MLKLEPSPLRLPTLHSCSSPALPCHALHPLRLPTKCTRTLNFREIFKRAFKIYGIWLQAHMYSRIHSHLHNAVPLVWGLLRLIPTIHTQWWSAQHHTFTDPHILCHTSTSHTHPTVEPPLSTPTQIHTRMVTHTFFFFFLLFHVVEEDKMACTNKDIPRQPGHDPH